MKLAKNVSKMYIIYMSSVYICAHVSKLPNYLHNAGIRM